jgi:hypothetical protein
MSGVPPAPPPPPGFKVGGGQGRGASNGFPPPPPPGFMRPGQNPPGPPGQHGPPPQNQQFNLPARPVKVNSSRIVDVTPIPVMDEEACRKRLTTYAVYTVKKAIPASTKELPSWARAEHVEERLDQKEIAKQVKRLSDKSVRSVAEQKAALAPNQQRQVVKVLDELASKERDPHFGWSLVQIGKEEQAIKVRKLSSSRKDAVSNKRETTTLTIYAMRAPLPNENCKMLYDLIEKHRIDMLLQQNRPPQNSQPNNQQNGPPPTVNNGPNAASNGPGFVNLGKSTSKSPARRSKSPAPVKRRDSKKYHEADSDDSQYDSDGSDSDSTRSSTNGTSISSMSRKGHRPGRRYSHTKPQNRSYSRHRPEHAREHRKIYNEDRRDMSPRRLFDDMPAPQPIRPPFVPEINRGLPEPGYDPVAAAYQAGKMDADAERFGLNERERYVPPPRAIERPVVIEQPRAVVSYGWRDAFASHPGSPPRITQARYSPPVISSRLMADRFVEPARAEYHDFRPESRGYAPDPREFRQEPRGYRHEHRDPRGYRSEYYDEQDSERSFSPGPPRFRGVDYYSRERDAEEYIERERPPFERRATEPRISPIIRNGHHPFAPLPLRRQYPPSMSTTDSGGW